MNIFEQELRRLAKACAEISNPVFAGRFCYGDLGGDNRVKLQFVTLGHADHYEAVKATVLNRGEGEVDSLLLRFGDTWGKKFDHAYKDGVPYIWTNDGRSAWYVYRPTDADFRKLGAEVGAYLDVFTIRDRAREKAQAQSAGQESVVQKLRDSRQNPAPRKAPAKNKKQEAEI